MLPGARDDRARRGLQGGSWPSLDALQELDGVQRRPSSWRRLKLKGAPKRGEKATHHQIAIEEFLRIGIIPWARQFSNRCHGCLQVLCRHTGINALAQGGGILCLIENNLACFGEHLRGGVEVMDGAQACLLPFPCRLRGGRPHEDIEEV